MKEVLVPDGYVVQMLPNGGIQIVPASQTPQVDNTQSQTMNVSSYEQTETDYNEDETERNILEKYFSKMDFATSPKKFQLTRAEKELLEFCHRTDMMKFLRENVGEKPLNLDYKDSILFK